MKTTNTVTYYKELEKPIIFIGTGRSGSSVISEIIMRHKNLAFPSQYQNKYLNNTSINYLRLLFDNALWRVHGQKAQLNKVGFLNRFTFRPVEAYAMWNMLVEPPISFSRDFLINTRASEESSNKIRHYFYQLVKKQGKIRLSFKITGPSRMEYLLSIFPDAQFVNLTREPIPVISSFLKVGFWESRGKNQLWWRGAYSEEELEWATQHENNPVALTALQIKKVMDVTQAEIEKCKPEIMEAGYADFIKNPEKTVENILGFTGLTHDQACFDYLKNNKIINRDKKDEEYFTESELISIQSILIGNLPVLN